MKKLQLKGGAKEGATEDERDEEEDDGLSAGVFTLFRLLLFINGPVRDSWLDPSDRPLQLD